MEVTYDAKTMFLSFDKTYAILNSYITQENNDISVEHFFESYLRLLYLKLQIKT